MSDTSPGLPYTAADDDIELAKAVRASTIRARAEAQAKIESEAVPLWDRLRLRKTQNSFGEEYDLSLTPRRAS